MRKSYPHWVRVGGRWAVRGPASIMEPGGVVNVWSEKRQEAKSVRLSTVVPEGNHGECIGYPSQRPLPPRERSSTEYDPETAHRGGRRLPRKGYHSAL